MIVAGGILVERQHPPAQFFRAAVIILRHRQIGPLSQKAHGIGIAEVFDLHNEIDDAAALLAAEAVVDLLFRRNGEGRRLFIVERTQAEKIGALAGQRDITADDVHNITAGDQLVQKTLRERHRTPPFDASFAGQFGFYTEAFISIYQKISPYPLFPEKFSKENSRA